ncbi:MAG: hypothetical protein J0L78_00530 [Planctomycetes bacterium]|nr:hypothetical protein [Planctomycetota bacterium]
MPAFYIDPEDLARKARSIGYAPAVRALLDDRAEHEAFGFGLLDGADLPTLHQVIANRLNARTLTDERIAFAVAEDLDRRLPRSRPGDDRLFPFASMGGAA